MTRVICADAGSAKPPAATPADRAGSDPETAGPPRPTRPPVARHSTRTFTGSPFISRSLTTSNAPAWPTGRWANGPSPK